MRGRFPCRALAVAAALWLLPVPSHAHLVNTGLGPFYDGVSHFALTPEDLLPALALALLAGQRGSRAGRLALFSLPLAWLLGGLVGGSFKGWLDAHHPLSLEEWTKFFRQVFFFTGGEIVKEFLISTGYLPGAHEEECPVYKKVAALRPAWMRTKS